MRAVVLAGGLGVRLRPYTTVLPKPLIPIGDRPILEIVLRQLADAGVTRADVCIGHLGELIQVYFSQAERLPPELELVWQWENEALGTAGALRQVPDLSGTFLVMNGDVLTNLDYRRLVDFHREQEAALTIAMHPQRIQTELGVIDHRDGTVTGYREKPAFDYDVSMGVYVYDERALAHLGDGPLQFPDLVQRLLEAGERVAAYRTDATWYDVGTLPEYERAVQALGELGD